MALTAYLAATNRLLQNPLPANPLYKASDLTVYINEARGQLAGDAQCIRAQSTAALTVGGGLYSFTIFTTFAVDGVASGTIFFASNPNPGDTITLNSVVWTFVSGAPVGTQIQIQGNTALTIALGLSRLNASTDPLMTVAAYTASGGPTAVTLIITYKISGAVGNTYTLAASAATPSGANLTGGTTGLPGIKSALTLRQLAVSSGTGYRMMISRPWPWFNRFYLANGAAQTTGTPNTWSQLGIGTKGSFGIAPVPSGAANVQADCVCLPVDLVDDTTAEALPYPFTDAVPYYAAYKAYLSSQKTQDATVMLGRYKEFVRRAVQESVPAVLPENFQGGRSAQIVATKQSLTDVGQGQQ